MKKIIITGGLGYIGYELCKIYSGKSHNYNVIVIDNKFFSKRVNQLRNWNIEYINADILDKNLLKNIIQDADIIHHLAGITDVPYVNDNEIDEKKLIEIEKISIEGTRNILDLMSRESKIIFPSTHVIFDGLQKFKDNLLESEVPCPSLVYSKSKYKNEQDIISSGKNFIILRLGSVYGFSEDSTRVNILPNLFSKISALNQTIRLFSGGEQIKNLVSLIDVARCFNFMEQNININKEIFNCVKETCSVKDIASICKKYSSNLKIVSSNDPVPNPGYKLSNKKIIKTGFKFLFDLDTSIKEMISKWSTLYTDNKIEIVKKSENNFLDQRGKISNYELDEPINLVGYIESKKGSLRANHYHPVQHQKVLLVKGQYISVYQDLLNKSSIKSTHIINQGDIVYTKPNSAHTMLFTQDSALLNLVRGEREHKNYGITHTVPYELVSNWEKDFLLNNYKFNCRCCSSTELRRVISLGYTPLANNLLNFADENSEAYPLELNYCDNCYNLQLSCVIDEKKLFSNYLYLSSVGNSHVRHFNIAAEEYLKEFNLNKNSSFIIDVGSNDGTALTSFKNLGFLNLLGIEPATNVANIANNLGIKTINSFLNKDTVSSIKEKADLVLISNVFAHVDDIHSMAECLLDLLNENGTLIIEVQYALNMMQDLTFDNMYHEHVNYWSLLSLQNFFSKKKATIIKAKKIDIHGGSIRAYIKKGNMHNIDSSVKLLLEEEKKFGLNNFNSYLNFEKKIFDIHKNVKKNFFKLKKKFPKIVGYGAPAKATTFINFFGLDNEDIEYIIEDNQLKINRFIPGKKIPIKEKNEKKLDCILVLAWNFFSEIKKNNADLSNIFINVKDLEDPNFDI